MKTNIALLLLSYPTFGKEEALEVVQKIVNDDTLFAELMTAFLGNDIRVTQRAAWIPGHFADAKPSAVMKYIKLILENLYKNPTNAVIRNSLRVLQFVKLPENCHEMAVDRCFHYLENRKEAVAIQVFAMTVLANLIPDYPELKNELQIILEDRLPTASAGFKSRAKKTLKQIT